MTAAAEKRSQKVIIKGTGTGSDLGTKSPKNNMPAYNVAVRQKWQTSLTNYKLRSQKRNTSKHIFGMQEKKKEK